MASSLISKTLTLTLAIVSLTLINIPIPAHVNAMCGPPILTPQDVLKNGFTAYGIFIQQGPNSTAGYNAVRSATAVPAQPFSFGDYYTFDMPFLTAPNADSPVLGRVQGHYTPVQQTGGIVFVTETFVVNNGGILGGINGSFTAMGLEYADVNSSKPILGGTSDFEFVIGVVTSHHLSSYVDSYGNLVQWLVYNFRFRKL